MTKVTAAKASKQENGKDLLERLGKKTKPGAQSVRENSVVPPGLGCFAPLFPALKRWAKLVRPSGALFYPIMFRCSQPLKGQLISEGWRHH